MLGCVRIATASQMARVLTAADKDGPSYVRRPLRKLEQQGLAETNGKHGKANIWHLTRRGQQTLVNAGELPLRPKAGIGGDAVKAGLGPHGVAVMDMTLPTAAAST